MWDDEYLNQQREIADPLADSVIHSVYEKGQLEAVNTLLQDILKNDDLIPDSLPDSVKLYFKETQNLPSWFDPIKIKAGEIFFLQHMIIPTLLLPCASLPECYALKNGVNVLWQTQLLEQHVHRRLIETAYMVITVMNEGGLSPNGLGLRAIQKVRLLHASIRYLISLEPPTMSSSPRHFSDVLLAKQWNSQWGKPINQEDMAFTILSFSYVVLKGLERLGVVVSTQEKEAFLHSWAVAGYLMGVDEKLLIHTMEDAETLYIQVYSRQAGFTEEGKDLSRALLQFLHSQVPVWWLKPLPKWLTWLTVHPLTRDALKLPPPGIFGRICLTLIGKSVSWFYKEKSAIVSKKPWLLWLTNHLAYALLMKLSDQPRGGNRLAFQLPEKLSTEWLKS